MARNKITKGNVTEELHDARLPDSLGTAGQVPRVNSTGTGFIYEDSVKPAQVAGVIEGGELLAADLNQEQTKVSVHFDLTGASAGQVPKVKQDGTGMEWATPVAVDQTYSATSENAQSGKAVAQAISTKQDTLSDGYGILIENNEISVDDTVFATKADLATKQNVLTDGYGIVISGDEISVDDTVFATKVDLTTKQDKLTDGYGILIENNEISVDDTVFATKVDLATKQDTISDLSTIRTNAENGAAAKTTIDGYGDIVHSNIADFATAAQGAKADTAVQDVKINNTSVITDNIASITYQEDLANDSSNAATTTAIRSFVNSSISASAANYVTSNAAGDNFATRAALLVGPYYYAGAEYTPKKHDYATVAADEEHSNNQARYSNESDTVGTPSWSFQYQIGSAFTAAQQAAIDSGVNATKVTSYDAHLANTSNPHSVTMSQIPGLEDAINAKQAKLTAGTGIKISTDNTISLDDSSSIAIYDNRIADADKWLTNGYTKTSAEIPTANLPSVCTGNDRWGVLLFVAENNDNHAGMQQYFPIDGTYKGRIFYRSVTGYSAEIDPEFGEWEVVPWTSEKQDTLVSGTNIKTINGETLLGSGNIPADMAPTSASANLITSGGVYTALEAKSTVTASSTGTSTTEAAYVTIDNNEFKIKDITAQNSIATVQSVIPTEATEANQLADKSYVGEAITTAAAAYEKTANKVTTFASTLTDTQYPSAKATQDFVNSSISTNTATFRGTSAAGLTEEEFLAWANGLTTKDNNDYVFWNTTDDAGTVQFKRYKYVATVEEPTVGSWTYEYTLNNSSFTAAQWATINSGVTAETLDGKVDKIAKTAASNTETGFTYLYGQNADGDPKLFYASDASLLNTIPVRNSEGMFKVGTIDTSSDGTLVANKNYVDTQDAKKQDIFSITSGGNLDLPRSSDGVWRARNVKYLYLFAGDSTSESGDANGVRIQLNSSNVFSGANTIHGPSGRGGIPVTHTEAYVDRACSQGSSVKLATVSEIAGYFGISLNTSDLTQVFNFKKHLSCSIVMRNDSGVSVALPWWNDADGYLYACVVVGSTGTATTFITTYTYTWSGWDFK